ncbi:lysophospholipid acyltransferase family protein [bacterium]|nr:lysophospholipid acyltransferase family protein [bacterium]
MAKRPKPTWQKRLETGLAKGCFWIIQRLPHRTAQKFGMWVGATFHDLLHIRVNHAVDELLRSFPDKDEAWAKQTVRNVYRHFGAVSAEMARNPVLAGNYDKWVHFDEETLMKVRRAFERGRGTFITAGHHGNWEYAGAMAAQYGFPTTFVVGEQTNDDIEELMDDLRRAAGLHIVKRKSAPRGIPKALKANHLVAMMIDQDARSRGIFIDFFGRPASTFKGVGLFAVKYNPSVLFMRTWRDEKGVIQVRCDEVEVPQTGDTEADILTLMTDLTNRLEDHIRTVPDQYLWLHKRWKTPPPKPGDEGTE